MNMTAKQFMDRIGDELERSYVGLRGSGLSKVQTEAIMDAIMRTNMTTLELIECMLLDAAQDKVHNVATPDTSNASLASFLKNLEKLGGI